MAGTLSVGMQQMLEISKALMEKSKIIIMDEPTAALTNNEIDTLFEQIKNLKKMAFLLYIFLIEWKKFYNFRSYYSYERWSFDFN